MAKFITPEQIRGARAMLGWSQQELAAKAGLSTGTLNNIERSVQGDPKLSTLKAIQQALAAGGIAFDQSDSGALSICYTPKRDKEQATVLIVDDNPGDRKLFRSWLVRQGSDRLHIIEAENAVEGYEAFARQTPDCIILDFKMYGMNGFQLLAEMKRDHHTLPPIIFVTGSHNIELEREVRAQGIHGYFNKNTLTAEQLFASVQKAMHA